MGHSTPAGLAPSGSYPSIKELPLVQNNSEPLGIALDGSGNVWLAENNPSAIVEYNPSTQNFSTFLIPTSGPSMIWFMLFDDRGVLWFANALQPFLWSFSLVTREFSNFSTGNPLVDPYALAYDAATRQIWFTSIYTDQIGSFQIAGNGATLVHLINVTGTARAGTIGPKFGPSGIAIDSQGNVYISETFSGEIAEFSQSDQRFVNLWYLPVGSEPVGIALDSGNHRIWFTSHATSLFGYLDQNTGQVTEYATSLFSYLGNNITLPYWIQLSANGTVWFDEHVANKMARFDPSTDQLTEFLVPTSQSAPLRFAIDNTRNVVWLTEFFGNKLGMLDENSSCGCSVQLSDDNLTLTGGPTSLLLKYTNSTNFGLINPAVNGPLISGSLSTNGFLSANLSMSSERLNSSYYKITLASGSSLLPGNYSLTICPVESVLDNATNPPPVGQCALAHLYVVQSKTSSESLTTMYVIAVIGVALIASLLIVRKRGRATQDSKLRKSSRAS
ncbi:MAG: Vgb family protein [Nitrososphaerales archaeon]